MFPSKSPCMRARSPQWHCWEVVWLEGVGPRCWSMRRFSVQPWHCLSEGKDWPRSSEPPSHPLCSWVMLYLVLVSTHHPATAICTRRWRSQGAALPQNLGHSLWLFYLQTTMQINLLFIHSLCQQFCYSDAKLTNSSVTFLKVPFFLVFYALLFKSMLSYEQPGSTLVTLHTLPSFICFFSQTHTSSECWVSFPF